MNIAQLKEFVCLETEKRRLEGEVKLVKQKLDDLKDALIPQFLEHGFQSTEIDGRTVYIHGEVRPAMVNGREQVVAALRTEGLDQYIGVNHQSFGAYVREVAREVEDDIARENAKKPFEQHHVMDEEDVRAALPTALREQVAVTFDHDLRSRKA
jgi:NADP-dependent 3-hydroxy acid dehydrogenase YdfG